MILAEGQRLQQGKYVIQKLLGRGGFGTTYKALQVQLNHQVVIKIPFDQYVDLFNEEKEILAKLSEDPHPNIVRARDFFMEGQTPCLVMDFISGESLYELIKKRGVLPEVVALECICQIGEALVEVHKKGIVHRDVNPKNIIRQRNGKTILIDFGIATKIVSSSQSKTSNSVEEKEIETHENQSKEFTEQFSPYEQIIGKGDQKCTVDVYSLAATLYYAITGKYPAISRDRKIYNIELIPPKKHNANISHKLNQAILKGMALDTEARSQSIKNWLKLLPISTNDSQVQKNPIFRQRWLKWNPVNLIFSRSLSNKIPSVELISDVGIDYEPLEKLLLEQKWREADRETVAIVLKILDREIEGWLSLEDLEKIPCRDLRIIDQMWVQYSTGRFGLSVQKQIWERVGGNTNANNKTWERFGKRVGWYVKFIGWTSDPINRLWSNWNTYIAYGYWIPADINQCLDLLKLPFAIFFNIFYFLVRLILGLPVFGMFSLFLFSLQKFRVQKGYFPTIAQPGKGILIGKGAKAVLKDMQEDRERQRQFTCSTIATSKRIEQQYIKCQSEVENYRQRIQLARSSNKDEFLVQESLENQKNLTETANLLQSNLDKFREYEKREKRKLFNLDRKISQTRLSLDWEISCLSSKLGEFNIS